MSALIQDLRIAVRGYLKKPLFTAVVVTILALAIGANSAIFTVVNAVLLRPLPYAHASSLVSAFQVNRDAQRRSLSPPNYFDLKEQTRTFSGMAAYWSPSVSISGSDGEPEKVLAATCSNELFGVLAGSCPKTMCRAREAWRYWDTDCGNGALAAIRRPSDASSCWTAPPRSSSA
jgi:putative ABC transport system permease protein